MKVMKKALHYGVSLVFVCSLFLAVAQNSLAASLKFDKATVSTATNQTFTVDVIVDAGTDQVTSADVWVIYDPTALEASSVANGTFFPAVTNNITSGKVSITGLIVDPGTYKTGSGTIATITFKALKDGTSTLTFDCRTDVSNSSKVIKNDVNATNIITCSSNGTSTVTAGPGGAVNPTSAPYTPQANPTAPASLPRTGIMENMTRIAAPGLLLLLAGLALRLIL